MQKGDNIDYRLIDEPHLMMSPTLGDTFSVNEALFIQQIHYWLIKSGKEIDGQKWIYNSIDDWHKQFYFWSKDTIRRILDKLINNEVIITDNFNKHKWDRTLWYTINYNLLNSHYCKSAKCIYAKAPNGDMQKCQMQLADLHTPIPVNYTETKTVKKIIIKDYSSIIKYLNAKTGKNYKARVTEVYYNILIDNEYKYEDFITVIDNMTDAWLGTKYEIGLHPEKLFGHPLRFDKYLNQTTYNENSNQNGYQDDEELL